jgi:hypothetical protein
MHAQRALRQAGLVVLVLVLVLVVLVLVLVLVLHVALTSAAMPVGLVAASSPFLFAQNFAVTAALACAFDRFTSSRCFACAVAFLVVLAKEAAEVFIEPGTGAVSDGVAALLGALATYAFVPTQVKPSSE